LFFRYWLASLFWDLSLRITCLCFEIFRLEESIVYASLGNLRLSSFALKHSPGNFSCVSVVWKLSIWNRSLEIFRRGCFAWELRLETFVWYASLGNLCLSSSALQLSMGNFCLGSFAWELSFGSFVFHHWFGSLLFGKSLLNVRFKTCA